MSRTITAAVVQIAAHPRTSLPAVWPGIAARVREAAARGARLIVLPEGTLPAYVLGYEPFEERETAAALDECRSLARGLGAVLVVGAARGESGRVYNSAIVIDADGTMAGAGDKHFLWHFDRQWFAPGERIEPVRTSIGVIGALVCADGRIPTIAGTLVDRGAEVLVMPTAWVTSGRDPEHLENVQADLMARVRARENGVPFLAANKCGVELGCVAYCGKSQIVAADGSVLQIAPEQSEATLFAEIELREPAVQRSPPVKAVPGSIPGAAVRIAIAARGAALNPEILRILEAQPLFSCPEVGDDTVLDPGGLARMRLHGVTIAVWRTQYDPQWQLNFARTRALELRIYLVVIDTARNRAYAVDPDGAVVCGTFGEYEIAGFTFDPARTDQTFVAPGTDVRAGLERAAAHAAR